MPNPSVRCATPSAGKGNAKGVLDEVGAKLSADEIRQWLVDPAGDDAKKAHAERKPLMKSYATLSKDDLDGLVAYMQTLKRRSSGRCHGRFDRRRFLDGLLGAGFVSTIRGDGLPGLALSDSASQRRARHAERRRRAGVAGEAKLGIALQVRQQAGLADPHSRTASCRRSARCARTSTAPFSTRRTRRRSGAPATTGSTT